MEELPCDGDGVCMGCKATPPAEDTLNCNTCATPWHVSCLSSSARPPTMADAVKWDCPDCTSLTCASASVPAPPKTLSAADNLLAAVRAIEADPSLSDQEKARRRQLLMSKPDDAAGASEGPKSNDLLDIIGGTLNCSICMQLPDRPVTTPCGHNFCLKCFEKWVGQGKRTCANCRNSIPDKVATNPRINSALVVAIRMAKAAKTGGEPGQAKTQHFVHNQNRPDTFFITERAKKSGKANACSGKIFVTIPNDHFGPILADNDPERNQGILVGESWTDRLECRQWGAHFPHVAGIAGQSKVGAQSVALSGGYEDDEDHGEWFLYTGSGGRDLSGNKRTNKEHSFDQKFDKMNEALRVSCLKGYPVRVVRSHKEKRSAYAPETGVRYDGIYRIEKCWRKEGKQGFKMCRYLFVRCDNEPAPWTSNEHGDRPRPFPTIKELKNAVDITERKAAPHWDYDEEKSCWLWKKTPPASQRVVQADYAEDGSVVKKRRRAQNISARERLLKEFSCNICRKVMTLPITTPCAHNFCKACLDEAFAGQSMMRERTCQGRRSLRAQKNIMKCPSCSIDIAEFLQNPQVNRELMNVIESLKQKEDESEENGNMDEAQEEADMSGDEKVGEVKGDKEQAKEDKKEEVKEEKDAKIVEEAKVKNLKAESEDDDDFQATLKTEDGPKLDLKKSEGGEEKTEEAVAEETKEEARESQVRLTPKRKQAAKNGGSSSPVSGSPMTRRSKRARADA